MHPEKTRLIEFGRHAALNRRRRGDGRTETFEFLGFTHICATTRKSGRFKLKRVTSKKRLRAKLQEVKEKLKLRRHLPAEQGEWLASVVRGHLNYYAVPDNIDAVRTFRDQAEKHWFRALRRRSHASRGTA